MQNYKDWIYRWVDQSSPAGRLARRICADNNFPPGGSKPVILARIKTIGAPEEEILAFGYTWKLYEEDAFRKPKEATLEKKLVLEVEKRGGLCWKFTSPGTTGVPDRIVMAAWGNVAFVEMKQPGKKPRPIQRKRADQIQNLGIPVYCLSSNQDIAAFLQEMFGDEI